jgi:antitoxin (DNA-binding transcriptional repressor) of toxin-antitoxin stability system
MKTVTIRELHSRTGQIVRAASRHGEIRVTDSGRVIAKIVPEVERPEVPYFARRKMSPAFRRLYQTGRLGVGGTDVTQLVSEDRDDRV